MSFLDRLGISLLAIPAVSLERGVPYVVGAGLMWVCLRYLSRAQWLVNRRLSEKTPTSRQLRREILCSLRTLVIFGLIAGGIVYAALGGWTRMYIRIERYGWTWYFASIVIGIFVHDAYFYWTHRLMHHPRLFRVVHRTHHLSSNPSPWAAYSFSAWEAVVQAGIAPLLIFTMPMHPLAFSTVMIWQIGINVVGHCGYELYPRWFLRSWWGCFFNTTTHHAQHHELHRTNFSLYFNIWDRLMGTNHRQYAERFTEITHRQEALKTAGEI
jgi:Delta7-sterol 5-desaturase